MEDLVYVLDGVTYREGDFVEATDTWVVPNQDGWGRDLPARDPQYRTSFYYGQIKTRRSNGRMEMELVTKLGWHRCLSSFQSLKKLDCEPDAEMDKLFSDRPATEKEIARLMR